MKNTKQTTKKSSVKPPVKKGVELKAKAVKPVKNPSPSLGTTVVSPPSKIKAVNTSFEGARRIDHLSFEQQANDILNPLFRITGTKLDDTRFKGSVIIGTKK